MTIGYGETRAEEWGDVTMAINIRPTLPALILTKYNP
jgi:hypothetical protein